MVLYLGTLAPTVLYLQDPKLLDAVMLQMQVSVLGIAHPTGYPTYLMLTHLFTYLPFGDPAYRVNFGSAFYAALAVVAVYAAGSCSAGGSWPRLQAPWPSGWGRPSGPRPLSRRYTH